MNLNQITLPVKDMDEATAFYRLLGFVQIVDTPHYARFECPDGEASFSLALEEGEYHNGAVIYFEDDDLDARVQELEARGIAFDQAPTAQPYLWREAVLHDPSGNRIKLYHAGSNRLHPPWRVERRG
ncbi:VOC family protein [Wenzhouxiangella marina]|uniref:Glyoxalase n=1 Tax=Wenzhouxiangella marina TaxID=1579979 RepID=A0A0K0XV55_9GAMM|nr:VOC family protein [Wenzhouxiangella marina]AKS41563.1 glyoxalase [Wenzhouxiangella marina]MBB6086678.1 catechol 2,3-dioxygenase-like lactoylglutathione lyase family enzyme [Wenzhouxiangella marina]